MRRNGSSEAIHDARWCGVNFKQYSITILKIYLKHFRDEICVTVVIIIIRSQKKNRDRSLSLRFEIFLQDIMSRALLPPVPDHAGGALHHLPGLALAVNLAESGPFSQLHVAVNLSIEGLVRAQKGNHRSRQTYLDQGNAVLHAESSDELLVHWLVTVLGQDAEESLPLVQSLGGLPHTACKSVSDERLLEDLLDGGVDVHGAGGGGGGWNVISLIVRHCEFLDD